MKLHHRNWYRIFKPILRAYINFYMRIRYDQKAPFPKGPKIFAVNHPTVWDAFPILCHKQKDHVSVMVEDQIWSFPHWRFFFTFSNQIKLWRDKRSEQSIEDARFMLSQRGTSILISPEGGRTQSGTLIRGKKGVIRLALECKAPIIPVGVFIRPRNIIKKKFHYVYRNRKYVDVAEVPTFRARYGVLFGEAIDLSEHYGKDLSMEEYQKLADEILERIYALAREAERLA
jgi:1-acyl-sn-glycerol-3-phosphate acyltransferase